MGEWLIAETELFGLAVQNWLLVTVGAFGIYGAALGLWRHSQQPPY